MKKLLLAAVAVVGLTACSRNNGTDVRLHQSQFLLS